MSAEAILRAPRGSTWQMWECLGLHPSSPYEEALWLGSPLPFLYLQTQLLPPQAQNSTSGLRPSGAYLIDDFLCPFSASLRPTDCLVIGGSSLGKWPDSAFSHLNAQLSIHPFQATNFQSLWSIFPITVQLFVPPSVATLFNTVTVPVLASFLPCSYKWTKGHRRQIPWYEKLPHFWFPIR